MNIDFQNLDWFQIFKGGTQVDSRGIKHDGNELIKNAIAGFNTANYEPPIVIGHPKTNSPAFGWVSELKSETKDGTLILYAKVKQALPEFIDWLKKGLYKNRSASFYPDGKLRHVGFLGAMPPAVKGLPNIFEDDSNFLEFEEEENTKFDEDKLISKIIDKISNLFNFANIPQEHKLQEERSKQYNIGIKKENSNLTKPTKFDTVPDSEWLDPVNYRYPMPDKLHIANAAARWSQVKPGDYTSAEVKMIDNRLDEIEKKNKMGKYNINKGGSNMSDVTLTQEELKDRLNQFAKEEVEKATKIERDKIVAEFEEKRKAEEKEENVKGIKEFVEKLKKDGKIIPAWDDAGMSKFMESLNDASEQVEFADGKKNSKLNWFKEFIISLGKQINFEELAKPENNHTAKSDFDIPENAQIDEERALMNTKVNALMIKDKISYQEALNNVINMEVV